MNSTTIRKRISQRGATTVISTALASGATTLIVALTLGWLTVGRSAVGRAEVMQLIAENAPYVRDRQALQNSVSANSGRIDLISERLREIERQGHRVEAKLDLLLSRQDDEVTR